MTDLKLKDIQDLEKDLELTLSSLDLETKKKELEILEPKTLVPNFWDNQNEAKAVLMKIEGIKKELETAKTLTEDIRSLSELFNTSEKETDQNQLIEEYLRLKKQLDEFSILKFLSGEYDNSSAYISIYAGQGGTESNDWAQMLLRMYQMYFDKKNWKYTITDMVKGSETGISSVTMKVDGIYVYGKLKKEHGTHRLVRLSPFNAQNLRQTSFAGVEVIPVIEEDKSIEIPDSDIDFKAVRSGGPGGQNVNKTSSAVQITHIPTGITVHCSQERSQLQNKQKAMDILKAKLWRIQQDQKIQKIEDIKGEHKDASWGNQIRNYVLHPYKLVKDLRTNLESQNPDDILDGNLDEFIEAQVRIE